MAQTDPRILIILMGSVGDVARGLVIIDKLKQRYPQSQISWLVEPTCAPIVKLHRAIDSVIIFERKRGWRAVPGLRRELRKLRPDITLDLQRHFKSGFFSWLSGAVRRIGFHRRDSKEFNWIFNTETIAPFDQERPKLLHYLEFVRYLGGDTGEPYSFGISAGANSIDYKIDANTVGIVLGSRWKSKDWVVEGYQRLLLALFERSDLNVLLLGDRSQIEVAKKLEQACHNDRILNLCGKTSLVELIGIIKKCRVCLGPDSGPGHLAAAVETPYVSLFGPTDPQRVAPYRSENFVVRAAIGCAPCNRKICPGLNNLCMRLISVEQAFLTVMQAGKSTSVS